MSQTVTSSSRRSAWKVRWARSPRTWGRQAASSAAKASAAARSSVGVSVAMLRIYTNPIGNYGDAPAMGGPAPVLDSIAKRMISTNQFKNGNHIDVDGTIFKIVEFQHVKPGKGGAFVRTKLRRAADGAVIDRTFRAGEKFRPVRTEVRRLQFLYRDGTDAHFMDEQSFEQLAIPETSLADPLKWIRPSETVDVLHIDDKPADVQLSASVELEVTHTEPGVRGDTASGGGSKPATLETGATVNVPLFVNIGDRVKVDTRSGSYMSRA